jgi:hypothetical protein
MGKNMTNVKKPPVLPTPPRHYTWVLLSGRIASSEFLKSAIFLEISGVRRMSILRKPLFIGDKKD